MKCRLPALHNEQSHHLQIRYRLTMSEPTNHSALKREVIIGRSFGYASSPISDEPAIMQKGMPKPSNSRAMTYMPAWSVSRIF